MTRYDDYEYRQYERYSEPRRRKKRRRRKSRIPQILTLFFVIAAVLAAVYASKIMPRDGAELSPKKEAALTAFMEQNGIDRTAYPDELLQLYERNGETERFVLEYPIKKDNDAVIDLPVRSDDGSVPLYMQWDQRWGYKSYGQNMIALNGCGPVCLSMVASYLLRDNTYDPVYMCSFAEDKGYYVAGNGTAWALMSEGAERLGLVSNELPLEESIVASHLNDGEPIICIMGPGDFTTEGHYIVLTDYNNGNVTVNDPNSYKNSERQWNFSEISGQIRNLWAYSAA